MNGLSKDAAVAVIGAGAMGAGIAQVAAQAGHDVLLFDAAGGAAEKGRASVLAGLDRQVEKGRLAADERAAKAARLAIAPSHHALGRARPAVAAIVERLGVT